MGSMSDTTVDMDVEVDVLIVGTGPAGASLAAFLGEYGRVVLLIPFSSFYLLFGEVGGSDGFEWVWSWGGNLSCFCLHVADDFSRDQRSYRWEDIFHCHHAAGTYYEQRSVW